MTNPVQPLDPIGPPPPVTPADTPSSPSDYAAVTPHGQGTAAYDIQADLLDGEITAAMHGSTALAGAGVLYPQGPRQAATERLITSPPGYGDFDITAGYPGAAAGEDGWPTDPTPGG